MSGARKFADPEFTASGARRATVALHALETLWFNTGTLCNIACENCYIESSPRNDRLEYLTRDEVRRFLEEVRSCPSVREIGFTGGEPFMNRDLMSMIRDCLGGPWHVLVLTNGMKPMALVRSELAAMQEAHPGRIAIRVSLDHYTREKHEQVRGPRSWQPALEGLRWLAEHGFQFAVAARLMWGEHQASTRAGFSELFESQGLPLDAGDPHDLVLFPEMDASADVPEITETCWKLLNKAPTDVMCASSRMIVKRKGAAVPVVVSCTLLPYQHGFELGRTLAEADGPVSLNHPFCAQFCVLGGASCTG
jgi:sulfatase maturation enzyme AslB (radical SAM superfamily)